MVITEKESQLKFERQLESEERTLVFESETKGKQTKVRYWSDFTLEITGKLARGFLRLPRFIQEFIDLSAKRTIIPQALVQTMTNKQKPCQVVIAQHLVNGKILGYKLFDQLPPGERITTKHNTGKEVSVVLFCEEHHFRDSFFAVKDFVTKGFPFSFLKELFDNHTQRNYFNETEKISLIQKIVKILSTEKKPIYSLFNDQIKIYDDEVLAVELITDSNKKQITIPSIIDALILGNAKRITFLRSNHITSSTIQRNGYHVGISTFLKGDRIQILWSNEIVKTSNFITLCKLMEKEKMGDYRIFYALAHLQHRYDFTTIFSVFSVKLKKKEGLPLLKEHAQTSKHHDKKLEHKLESLFTKPLDNVFITFKEALLSDIPRQNQKIVDWFLVPNSPSELAIAVELRTLKSHSYRTRILQRTIDEYAKLSSSLLSVGYWVVVVNWLVTDRWLYYARNRGIILLGSNDITKMTCISDFLLRVKEVHTLFSTFSVFQKQQEEKATALLNKWLEQQFIPCKDIPQYAFYLQLQIQFVKNLLTFYQVMDNVDVNNRYHDHHPILIDNPQSLMKLHEDLSTDSSRIIIEEELDSCKKTLKKLTLQSQEQNIITEKAVVRRRETKDVSLLRLLAEDLSNLLSMRQHWGLLQPLGVRLYHNSENQGHFFAEYIYRLLIAEGLVVIRHVILKDSYLHPEIDFVVFNPSYPLAFLQKFLLSCTDKSSIDYKALKVHLNIKYLELDHLTSITETMGFLFVLVNDENESVARQFKREITRVTLQDNKVKIIIINEKQLKDFQIKISNKMYCHREVSFESIYIVKTFFSSFALYIYRKITIELKIRERRIPQIFSLP